MNLVTSTLTVRPRQILLKNSLKIAQKCLEKLLKFQKVAPLT